MEKDAAEALELRLKKIERRLLDLERGRVDMPANALGILRRLLDVSRRNRVWNQSDWTKARTEGADLVAILNDLREPTAQEREDKKRPLGG